MAVPGMDRRAPVLCDGVTLRGSTVSMIQPRLCWDEPTRIKNGHDKTVVAAVEGEPMYSTG